MVAILDADADGPSSRTTPARVNNSPWGQRMKRALSIGLLGVAAALLGGCPIYPEGRNTRVCDGVDCFLCSSGSLDDRCVDWQCNSDGECPSGYRCDSTNRCKGSTSPTPPSSGRTCSSGTDCRTGEVCGSDNRCHTGSCADWGCPSSQICRLQNGVPQCTPGTRPDGGPGPGCYRDSDCTSPPGSKCLSGTCAAPADQCSDATQCPNAQQCVQGVCTPSCSSTKPCPTGYACDLAKGVCTNNPKPCTEGGNQCAAGTTCVQQHCVALCGVGNTCPSGLICVDGGCMPDQRPVFTCAKEGVRDACAPGSICLRHSCYITCDSDASNACRASDKFNVCKQVTTASGVYAVCGSDANLGTECDPTQNKGCNNPLICIDGFCR